jgi:hypothetical protein
MNSDQFHRIQIVGTQKEIEGSGTRPKEFRDILELDAENPLANWIFCIKPQA